MAKPDKLIAPDGLVIITLVVPVTVAVPLILPLPVAVNVTIVPLSAPPLPRDIGLLLPEFINESVPPDVTLLPRVIPPSAVSVKLKPPVPAVDVPLPFNATEFVKVMLPAAVVV